MAVLDNNNRLVPTGKIGEVCIQGPNVTKGYLNNPSANKEAYAGVHLTIIVQYMMPAWSVCTPLQQADSQPVHSLYIAVLLCADAKTIKTPKCVLPAGGWFHRATRVSGWQGLPQL